MTTSSSDQTVDVVIVGAGLSGLRAARDVHNGGLSYVILEAMDRVGGKTLSVPTSDTSNACVDMGAAWLNDTSQSEVYSLAQEFGFDLVKQRTEGQSLYRDDKGVVHALPYGVPAKLEPEQMAHLETLLHKLGEQVELCNLNNPEASPEAKDLDSMTVQQFAETKLDSEAAVSLVGKITHSLVGVESHEISALFFLDALKRGTGLEDVLSDFKNGGQYLRNRQGNQQFSVKLAETLHQDTIKLSSPVTYISQTPTSCTTKTKEATYNSKKVIVSVPSPLYSKITFHPPLPPEKQLLTKFTLMGYYSKTVLVFNNPWWWAAGLSGEYSSAADGPITFTRDTCVPEDEQYSITCFHTAQSGREWGALPAEERRSATLRDFKSAFEAVVKHVPEPINVIEKDWTADPWAQGGPGPMMKAGGMTNGAWKALCEPFGSVHFVGTETADLWKGYMEGAVRSGVRGAREVIEALAVRE